jgi:hypothetical protein
MSPTLLRSFLQSSADEGSPNLGLDEIDEAVTYVAELQAMDSAESVALASAGYEYWLKKRRFQRMYQSVTSQEDWSPEELLEKAQREQSQISKTSSKVRTKFRFGEGIDAQKFNLQRFSTGIAKLDGCTGGGWARTEHVLWIAPTGAGKTVMACQQAVQLARQGLLGVLITTEQDHEELEPRIISAFANIPFERIKDGIDLTKLTVEETKNVRAVQASLQDNLFIEDWVSNRELTVESDLDKLVEDYKKEHGRCDFVILDWIGGAITAGISDASQLRLMYQNTADCMSNLAKKHNMLTQSFAQAHPKQAQNKPKVDQGMISECKTIGRNATYIFGISAMEEAEMADNKTSFRKEQFLHCSKGRKSLPFPVRVKREFEYQRFRDWWS